VGEVEKCWGDRADDEVEVVRSSNYFIVWCQVSGRDGTCLNRHVLLSVDYWKSFGEGIALRELKEYY
jgi:hypothetical protein